MDEIVLMEKDNKFFCQKWLFLNLKTFLSSQYSTQFLSNSKCWPAACTANSHPSAGCYEQAGEHFNCLMFKSSFSSPTIFVSWETLLLCNLCLLQNDFLWSNWNRPVNRLSGWGKSEENKGQEQTERRGGDYAPLAPLADLFLHFSPLQSLFTG